MSIARLCDDGSVRWLEVCYCAEPLAEERSYWSQYFVIERIVAAYARHRCRHESCAEPFACRTCDCTGRLGAWLTTKGLPFLDTL